MLNALGNLRDAERSLQTSSTVSDQTLVHSELGTVYTYLNQPAVALEHFQQAIKLDARSGKYREVANLQFNVAIMLGNNGQLKEAIEYATAALAGYERLGLGNEFQAQETRRMLGVLRQAQQH